MRMSVVKDDPGYHKNAHKHAIYINGKPVLDSKILTIDWDQQYYERYTGNDDGVELEIERIPFGNDVIEIRGEEK